jgi:hypothetical protein
MGQFVRYDLCRDAALRMRYRLLGMNDCASRTGLVARVMDANPQLDRDKVREMVDAIFEAHD